MAELKSSPIATRPTQVEFTNRFVQPPSALYIDRDDRLFISSRCTIASLPIEIRGRLLTPKGRMVTLAYDHTTSDTPIQVATSTFDLQEGFLLGIVAAGQSDFFLRGELYLSLSIVRGGAAVSAAVHELSNGYVEMGKGVSWPPGRSESSISGHGRMRQLAGNDPAAGVEISQGVPPLAVWQLHAVRFVLVTDATVANRRVRFEIRNDGVATVRVSARSSQPASQTVAHNLFPSGESESVRDNEITMSLPSGVRLTDVDTFHTDTVNLQAGDNFGAPELYVEQWIQGF